MSKKLLPRIIPCLLLKNDALVKTVRFQNPSYVGDPVNAIKIYNEKEVDELIFLDIIASEEGRKPNYDILKHIADECFMPLCYGGGIKTIEEIRMIFSIGVEKISLNSSAIKTPSLISETAKLFGSQSIIVSIDIKKTIWGKYEVYSCRGTKSIKIDPVSYAKKVEQLGAGEILLTSIDKEGTWEGYDTEIIKKVTSAVNIPVIANGGAGNIADFSRAYKSGASAMATGSLVVYQKKGMGVLINFPKRNDLMDSFFNKTN